MFKVNKKGQKALNKFFSSLTIFSLVLQSLSGIFFLTPTYAQEITSTPEVVNTPTSEPTAIVVESTAIPTIQPTDIPAPTDASTITPTPVEEVLPTPTDEITPTPTIEVLPTDTITPTPETLANPPPQTTDLNNPQTSIESAKLAVITPEITPTSIPSQWTFEKVELNKEYIAPQNSEVKLTFTKLPDPSGNIKIEEITLTQEQIKQTGSLSDKAYDITSDMKDGDFSYNLSLPIPEASKGKTVEVKFAEELSNIGSAEKVENTLTKTDTSVSVTSLDHFTIFIITDDSATYSGTWIDYASQGYSEDGVHYPATVPAGQTATWTFSSLAPAGSYKVYVSWSTHSNRTQVAPYVLNYNGGSTSTEINQEQLADQTTTGGSLQWSGWFYLGTHDLNTSSNLVLTSVNNASGTDYVIADEVLLAPNTAPTTVWVDDNYTINSKNDGHVWGYDAFTIIQDGVTAVASGGTVNVATGTYIERLKIENKPISLLGANKADTFIQGTAGPTDEVISIKDNISGVTIVSGFTIDAIDQAPSGGWGGTGVWIQGSQSVTIENNNIVNFRENGILIGYNSNNNIIRANTITGSDSGSNTGINFSDGATGNTIGGNAVGDGNTISLVTSGTGNLFGVYLSGTNSGNNTIKSNTFNGGTRFVQQDPGISGTTTISENNVGNSLSPTWGGISLNGGSAIISGNTLKNAVRPIDFWGAVNVTISGNIINGSVYDGINAGSASGTVKINGDNKIYNIANNHFGIHVQSGVLGIEIDGNEIYSSEKGVGIESGATGAKITNNNIYNNSWSAIELHEAVSTLIGNTITGDWRGIETWNSLTAHDNIFTNNAYGSVIFRDDFSRDVTNNWWGNAAGPSAYLNGTNLNTYNQADQVEYIQANSYSNFTYKPWCTDSGCTTFSSDNPATTVATDVTSTGATLNGTVGTSNADNTSFWWTDMTTPDWNVHENPVMADLGSAQYLNSDVGNTAGASYSHTLSGLTPSTLYHFVTFNRVGGIWYPGAVLTFTTANGPVFIDANVNGVLDSGEQSFNTIQAAINAATSGNTIHVTAGEYTEQVIINKSLTLQGAGRDSTKILSPVSLTLTGTGKSGILAVVSLSPASPITVDISGITVDGQNQPIDNLVGVHFFAANGSLSNSRVTGMRDLALGSQNRWGVFTNHAEDTLVSTHVTISGNIINNYQKAGIVATELGSTMTATGNTVTGAGPTTGIAQNGIESNYGASATISGNNIVSGHNYTGLIDDYAAGILVVGNHLTGNPAQPSTSISNNTVSDNEVGVAVSTDTRWGYGDGLATINNNSITSNITGVKNDNLSGTLDATNNNWGTTVLDEIETFIDHNCTNSPYVHGSCNAEDNATFGFVKYAEITTPTNEGWNLASQSATPNEQPLDLVCTAGGVATSENSLAQNWSAVGGSNIKYQREVTFPSSAVSLFDGGSNNYTPFSTFGAGDQGQWGTRVRAYVDANGNNIIDSGEEMSGWSNECNITFDKTNPTDPGTPTTTPNPTNSLWQNWLWSSSADIGGSGVKGYYQSIYDVLTSGGSVWSWIGNVLGISTNLTDGQWQLQLQAEDNAGNQSVVVNSSTLIVDTVAPSSSVSSLTYDGGGNISVSFVASDPAPASGVTSTTLWFRRNTGLGFDAWTTSGLSLTGNSGTFAFNPSNIDGQYEFYSISTDAAGNFESAPVSADDTTLFDNINPTGSWVTPSSGSFLRGIVSLEASAADTGAAINSGVKQVRFYYKPIGGSSFTAISAADISSPYQGSWNTISRPDGSYVLRAIITDNAGNTKNLDLSVTVDNTDPVLSSQTIFADWYTANQTSTFTYTDTNDIASGTPVTCVISTEGTAQTCSVTPNVCDAAGNCNTTPVTSNGANIDFADPESTITTPTNPSSGSTIYMSTWSGLIKGTATDVPSGVNGVKISIQKGLTQYFDGTNFVDNLTEILLDTTYAAGNWEYAGLTSPVDGSYTIKSHAIDNAGNVEDSYTLTVILDKSIPEVTISLNPAVADASNGWYKTQPEVTLTATDSNIDKIEYQWDSQTGTWTTYSAPFKPGNEGSHVLYYRAWDKAGNVSGTGVKNISWDQTELNLAPQNVSADPNPTSGSTSKIKWESAKDNIGIDKYEVRWSMDGTSTSYTDTVGSDVREHEIKDLLTEGRWTVSVRAFDAAGHSLDSSIDLYVDRTGPVAPTLSLTGTGVGIAILSWTAVTDATDYIVWYGNVPGSRLFGARVGNVTSYTVRGLGAGNYYFIVKAVDSAQNQSVESNEINTGTIAGALGVIPGNSAEGFTPEVEGVATEATPSSTPESQTGLPSALGEATKAVSGMSTGQRILWALIILSLLGGGYYFFKNRESK